MAKNVYGLKSILISAIAADGGMGTAFTEVLGQTVRGTASLTETEVTTTDILIEESDDPILSIYTGGGVFQFVFSSYNLDPAVLVQLKGGTIGADGLWEAPEQRPNIELSVRAETMNGYIIEAARVKMSNTLAVNMQKEAPGQINMTGTVLQPTKAGVKKIRMGIPTPPPAA